MKMRVYFDYVNRYVEFESYHVMLSIFMKSKVVFKEHSLSKILLHRIHIVKFAVVLVELPRTM